MDTASQGSQSNGLSLVNTSHP